jgi:TIR domain
MPFFHIIELGWRTEAFGPTDATFSKPGVYILLSGKIEAADNAGVILDGESEPILYVKLPGEVEFKHRDFRLLADVKIGAIGAVGLAKFGVATYRNILGVLRDYLVPDSASSQRRQAMAKKHVFLSYCRDNQKDVSQLRDDLMAAGEQVWWDLDILGGQDWKQQIRKAMKEAYAVLVCFSKETDARPKSGIFPELLDAIKAYREYAPGSVFLIPVRLSNCSIPDVEISDTKTLDSLQFIDLFPPTKRKSGLAQLIRSLQSAPEHP